MRERGEMGFPRRKTSDLLSFLLLKTPSTVIYVTRSDKRGLKSLGSKRAAGKKEVKDNHYNYVLHLTDP